MKQAFVILLLFALSCTKLGERFEPVQPGYFRGDFGGEGLDFYTCVNCWGDTLIEDNTENLFWIDTIGQ